MVNRKDLSRRIAQETGFTIKDTDEVLKALATVMEDALRDGEEIKFDKLFKVRMEVMEEKWVHDGLNNRSIYKAPRERAKFHKLSGIEALERDVEEAERDRQARRSQE